MIFAGSIRKGERYWLAEVPSIDLMTQGETKREALDMTLDAIVTLVDKSGFKVEICGEEADGVFGVRSADTQAFVNLSLERGKRKV